MHFASKVLSELFFLYVIQHKIEKLMFVFTKYDFQMASPRCNTGDAIAMIDTSFVPNLHTVINLPFIKLSSTCKVQNKAVYTYTVWHAVYTYFISSVIELESYRFGYLRIQWQWFDYKYSHTFIALYNVFFSYPEAHLRCKSIQAAKSIYKTSSLS